MLAVNPCLSPVDVEQILKQTSDQSVHTANPSGFIGYSGAGLLDAHAAVLEATTYGDVAPITSNTTWTGDRYVKGTVAVQSGTLTITGTVRMAEDARFEVKPNAKLVIDGGTITRSSGCFDSRWNGIYVSGTSSSSQTVNPTHFGTVELKNGAVVEHAKEALNNFGLTSGGSLDWGAFGGIIQATEATFRNNRRSAQFMAYTNTNSLGNPINDKGFFTRCTFTVDDDMTPLIPYCNPFAKSSIC